MKRNMIFTFLLMSVSINAQEYKIEEKTVVGVFEIIKPKSELFTSINKWISVNYNSAINVIQMNDLESGTIIIKGINEVNYKNPGKVLNPNIATDFSTIKFNHLIEINIKENRYRITYKLVNIASDDYGYNTMYFNCINLSGNRDAEVQTYLDAMEVTLKKGMVGKEKRDNFLSDSKLSFNEINTNLISEMKSTMLSIEKSISKESSDDW